MEWFAGVPEKRCSYDVVSWLHWHYQPIVQSSLTASASVDADGECS